MLFAVEAVELQRILHSIRLPILHQIYWFFFTDHVDMSDGVLCYLELFYVARSKVLFDCAEGRVGEGAAARGGLHSFRFFNFSIEYFLDLVLVVVELYLHGLLNLLVKLKHLPPLQGLVQIVCPIPLVDNVVAYLHADCTVHYDVELIGFVPVVDDLPLRGVLLEVEALG